ncbi:MAG: oxidoreductase [Blastomonas fulva]|jgi:2,4-dienoyl-CoA reductase-like NADH-dependent reductase (Old Yellow Enzyme family)|uniref:oxidoreductase n=1 Tax=Blastomonas TaxID=150203 RepID=UPI0006B9E641|nr:MULTISPECIES: 12-oxophytodienoate reductase [unclassified Blastomonas]AOG00727.1 flavin oxidoreductase / NADH oxidase family protein [Blastomonas sp. RAC04]KPF74073.1 1,2-oxophytodienoate reductase [Blastomonas sp. AAP25]
MRNDLAPLFSPFACGPLVLANRFVMSPMTRQFSPGGVPGENVAAYYARRAAAGVGLIITEGVGVDHPAAIGHGSMGEHDIPVLHGHGALSGWRRVVDGVHAVGGKIMPQLWHMGGIRQEGTPPHPQAPSLDPYNVTDEDIVAVIAAFARSAANAKAVGFDGVALHGAHGYLIDSFLWAATNTCNDAWGGDILRRTRFATEVVQAVRTAVGPGFPIVFRLSQWKLQDYEARLAETPEQLAVITDSLSEAGVDIFDVSTRVFSTPAFAGSEMGLAGWVRRLSGKAVITVGGIGFDRELAASFAQPTLAIDNLDEVVRRFTAGEFDLVALGRALLMDAEWVNKAREGKPFAPFDLSAYARLD